MTAALKGAASILEQRRIGAGGRTFLRVRCPRLGRVLLGNLDRHVGVVEHFVARAAQEAALGRSMVLNQASRRRSTSARLPGFRAARTITLMATSSTPLSTAPAPTGHSH